MALETSSEIHVRFADIDAMGHVNNAIYLNYFEQARMDFFKELVNEHWDWNAKGIILARNEIDYISPVQLHDRIEILTSCAAIGKKSMTLTYQVVKKTSPKPTIVANGKSILVAYDYIKCVPIEIPDIWKKAI